MYSSTSIIGNVGQNPEVKQLPSGAQVTNFSVAVSTNYLKNGEKCQRTEWFNVSAFGKLSEICSAYCVKGKQVFIEGEIKTTKWDDKNGNKRESVALIARTMKLLGGASSENTKGNIPLSCLPIIQDDAHQDGIPF